MYALSVQETCERNPLDFSAEDLRLLNLAVAEYHYEQLQ
jgi:hypothetical protein